MKNFYVDNGVAHQVQVAALAELYRLVHTSSPKPELNEPQAECRQRREWQWQPAAVLLVLCAVPLALFVLTWML